MTKETDALTALTDASASVERARWKDQRDANNREEFDAAYTTLEGKRAAAQATGADPATIRRAVDDGQVIAMRERGRM